MGFPLLRSLSFAYAFAFTTPSKKYTKIQKMTERNPIKLLYSESSCFAIVSVALPQRPPSQHAPGMSHARLWSCSLAEPPPLLSCDPLVLMVSLEISPAARALLSSYDTGGCRHWHIGIGTGIGTGTNAVPDVYRPILGWPVHLDHPFSLLLELSSHRCLFDVRRNRRPGSFRSTLRSCY